MRSSLCAVVYVKWRHIDYSSEEAQQQHRLERVLGQLDRVDLLIVDELGYLSFSRGGAELLFQVFADRMTAALLDRLTHRCETFEMNGESYRFRESMKAKKEKDPKKGK